MGNLIICPHTKDCGIYLGYKKSKIGKNIDVIHSNFAEKVYYCYALDYVNQHPEKKPSCIESSVKSKDLECLHLKILNKLNQLAK